MNKIRVFIVGLFVVGLSAGTWWKISQQDPAPPLTQSNSASQQPESTNEQSKTAAFDKTQYPLDKPGSIWWVVNKQRPLPAGYVPADLTVPNVRLRLNANAEQMQFTKTAEPALIEMFSAAARSGITLVFGSGYRSEALQRQFYTQYVNQSGQSAADKFSARPGTSEHQTGLSFDVTAGNGVCHLEVCFENTPEGKWVIANASNYGFVVRYPEGKDTITGYQYEPWHLRYIGKELAAEMKRTGVQTLEEFFDLPPAPTY